MNFLSYTQYMEMVNAYCPFLMKTADCEAAEDITTACAHPGFICKVEGLDVGY